jgi:two-component sensor histidine kinase
VRGREPGAGARAFCPLRARSIRTWSSKGDKWRAGTCRVRTAGVFVSHAHSSLPKEGQAVVEPKPSGDDSELTLRALNQRIRQQEILSELGVLALQNTPFLELINQTARFIAEGLQVEFAKVMEYLPSKNQFLVRAGTGWKAGVVGVATVGADLDSPAGYALKTGKPVISNHLENEARFRTPNLLAEHGARRAMNVIVQGNNVPFGVLEVDSRSEGQFVESDIAFLQGAANILGMAIERQRHERNLKAALDRHQVLLKEINHRVKNSLALVAAMFHLQARDIGDPAQTQYLEEAASRVSAIARAHERLYRTSQIEWIELAAYLRDVCKDLEDVISGCEVHVEAPDGIKITPDRAIPLALIVAELVTNAVKHSGQTTQTISVRAVQENRSSVLISVRDNGDGLPAGFDPKTSKGFGMRIVTALSQKLGGELKACSHDKGAEFTLRVDLENAGEANLADKS